MKFVCLGYLDEKSWDALSEEQRQKRMEECFRYDDELRRDGHFAGGEALMPARHTATIQKRHGAVTVTDGPFAETHETLGGILYLEAASREQAIALMSKHPGIGIGPFEIHPIDESMPCDTSGHVGTVAAETGPVGGELRVAITRMVDAPPERIFDAWTNSSELSQWWGPRSGGVDWATPYVESEPKPGGKFRTCIRSPEGQEYWAGGVYRECVNPTRLVFTHGWQDDSGRIPISRTVTVDFLPSASKTRVELRIDGYPTEESRDNEIEGWTECLDRLVRHLESAQGTRDEDQIRARIAEWSRALEEKDLDRLLADYAPDILLFDAIPPYKIEGLESVRTVWDNCLPYFPKSFRSEHRDLRVHVDGDLAFMHALHHFVPTDPADHPCGSTWMRITVCYRRTEGRWNVVHEHVSIPFNPMTNQAWTISDPDALDMPDYSEVTT